MGSPEVGAAGPRRCRAPRYAASEHTPDHEQDGGVLLSPSNDPAQDQSTGANQCRDASNRPRSGSFRS